MSADQCEAACTPDHSTTSHDADTAAHEGDEAQLLVTAANWCRLGDAEVELKQRDRGTRRSSPGRRPRRSPRRHAPSIARLASTLHHNPAPATVCTRQDATQKRARLSWSLLAARREIDSVTPLGSSWLRRDDDFVRPTRDRDPPPSLGMGSRHATVVPLHRVQVPRAGRRYSTRWRG